MMQALSLGASLYVPATRPDLVAIGNRVKYPALRSVIYCTEDAVHADELARALDQLAAALPRLEPSPLRRFVRVRNPAVLRAVLGMDGAGQLAGFVLPKITSRNLAEYLALLEPAETFALMPTLETAEVFDPAEMMTLRTLLLAERCRHRVLSLRIGGNDLLHLLGLRRPADRTLYATPLGSIIGQLVTLFRPHGLNLTGPVFEYLDHPALLARETRRDLACGLFGKSAVHPEQVPVIEAEYRVHAPELDAARRILETDAPPVFRLHGAMCEPTTHRTWAELICTRAELYGVRPEPHPKRMLFLGSGDRR
jgi:citrate lyase beta subunit